MGDRGLLKNTTEVMINRKSLMGPAKVMISEEVLLTRMNIDRFNENAMMPLNTSTAANGPSNLSNGNVSYSNMKNPTVSRHDNVGAV
jgi:hypothetical protein